MVHPRVLVLVTCASVAVFAALLVAVAVHGGPLPLDGAVRDLFAGVSTDRSRRALRPLGRLGAREVLVPLLVLGGGWVSLRRRTPGPLLLLVGSYLGMAMVVGPVKSILHRPEPFDLPGEIGRSFPSGHAAQAALVYGLLAVLVAVRPVPARARAALAAGPVLLCAVVGFVVLFRDSHWLSDMVAGYAVGLAWTTGPVAAALLWAPWLLGLPGPGSRRRTRVAELSG